MKILIEKLRRLDKTLIELFWLSTIAVAACQIGLSHFMVTHPHGLMIRESLPDRGDGHTPGSYVRLVRPEIGPVRDKVRAEVPPPPASPAAAPSPDRNELSDWALTLPAAGHQLSLTSEGEFREKPPEPKVIKARTVEVARQRERIEARKRIDDQITEAYSAQGIVSEVFSGVIRED